MLNEDVEAIERATFAAVPPDAAEQMDGWLLGLDHGTVGRAHSAVPLAHVAPAPDFWRYVEARYAAHGLAAVFRVPRVACFDGLRETLGARGYLLYQPTCVQVGDAASLARWADTAGVTLCDTIDDDWAAVFLGEGFDPVDGAHCVRLLRRARQAVHAGIRINGSIVAVGSGGFGEGWVGVHGMRTAQGFRGQGLASRILAALGAAAQTRGVARVFLQVDAANPACALYRRAGFSEAWVYEYWCRSVAAG